MATTTETRPELNRAVRSRAGKGSTSEAGRRLVGDCGRRPRGAGSIWRLGIAANGIRRGRAATRLIRGCLE